MSEEEKKAIQLLKSYAGMTHKLTDNQGRPKLDQAIERVLNLIEKQNNRLEQLEKENKELTEYLLDEHYVPATLIREKIEKVEREEKIELKGLKGQDRYYVKQEFMYKKNILKELLGEEYDNRN